MLSSMFGEQGRQRRLRGAQPCAVLHIPCDAIPPSASTVAAARRPAPAWITTAAAWGDGTVPLACVLLHPRWLCCHPGAGGADAKVQPVNAVTCCCAGVCACNVGTRRTLCSPPSVQDLPAAASPLLVCRLCAVSQVGRRAQWGAA